MLTLSTRPATLKYFTVGSSGVRGLNTSFRYLVVRLAYAGESTIDNSREVNVDGRPERDRENGASLVFVNCSPKGDGKVSVA